MHIHLPPWEGSCIYVPSQGPGIRDEVISGPKSSREDVVSDEDSSHCFALEPFSLRVRLGQEVGERSVSESRPGKGSCMRISLYDDSASTIAMLWERQWGLTARCHQRAAFSPLCAIAGAPPPFTLRTHLSASPFVCGIPGVDVGRRH